MQLGSFSTSGGTLEYAIAQWSLVNELNILEFPNSSTFQTDGASNVSVLHQNLENLGFVSSFFIHNICCFGGGGNLGKHLGSYLPIMWKSCERSLLDVGKSRNGWFKNTFYNSFIHHAVLEFSLLWICWLSDGMCALKMASTYLILTLLCCHHRIH